MPNRDDELSRDERDAVSAEELLRRLKGEMESKGESQSKPETLAKEDSHISDEAEKTAREEIVRGNPDEFGDDLESLMRMVMNMPAEEVEAEADDEEASETEIANEDESESEVVDEDEAEKEAFEDEADSEDADETLTDDGETNSDEDADSVEVTDDTIVYSQLSFEVFDNNDDEAEDKTDDEVVEDTYEETTEESDDGAEETAPETADEDVVEDSDPWYDDDNEEIFKALAEENKPQATSDNDEGDKSFLSNLGRLMDEEPPAPIPEEDDYGFVDEKEEAATEPTNGNSDGVVGEDGGREYTYSDGREFNSTEYNLFKIFKNEEDAEKEYGKQTAEKMYRDSDDTPPPTAPAKKKFYEYFSADFEYTSHEQDADIRSKYSRAFGFTAVRFVLCIIFAALVFVFENMPLLGITASGPMNVSVYPVVYAMIDLQLVVLCGIMAYRSISSGLVSLFKLRPNAESVSTILFAASIIYTATIATSTGIREGAVYNFPIALAMVFTLFGELLNLKREAMGFGVVSSTRRKYAIRHLSDEERARDAELFEEYVPEGSPMFAVVKVGFVDGFFKHLRPDFTRRKFTVALLIINAAEVALATVFGMISGANAYSVVTMAYGTLVLGLSSTYILSCVHPFYHASKVAFDNDSAVIGESSLKEYSDGSVVFFDDKDVFPATGVKINSVKVYGENRIDTVIYYAASVFARTGGPLRDVFSLATVDIGHSESLDILEGEKNGLYCSIDGTNIYVGTNDYMISKGYETPYGENDSNLEKSGIRLMYMADEEEILAKFVVQYAVDSEYELIFKQLYKAGMCVGIRTNDPNIDTDFVMKKFKLNSDYPVRVVHFGPDREIIRTTDRCESGIVSAHSVKSLLKALSLCDRVKYVSKIHNLFLILGAVLSVLLVYVVAMFGKLGIGSAYTALYQLFWMIPMLFVTMFTE